MAASATKRLQTHEFIECIRDFPCLYDRLFPEYKDAELKESVWKTVGERFNLTAGEAASKWRNIRDRYMRIKKQSEQENGVQKTIKWCFYPILNTLFESCLKEINKTNELEAHPAETMSLAHIKQEQLSLSENNSIDDVSQCFEGTDDGQDDDDEEIHGEHESTMYPVVETIIPDRILDANHSENERTCFTNNYAAQTIRPNETVYSRKRRNENDEFMDAVKRSSAMMEKLVGECEKDSVYHFSQNLCLRLRALPPLSRTMAMNRIENLLYESEVEFLTKSG